MKAVLEPVKLFSDRTHYQAAGRSHLADLLRPYWKEGDFGEDQRKEMYGLSSDDFVLAPDLAQADLAVLPLTWNHYLARNAMSQAAAFVKLARRAARPVLSYVAGDEGVRVPAGFDDVYVVRASGFRSRCQVRQEAQPVFFEDPWKCYTDLAGYERPKSAPEFPRVGFCGQAGFGVLKLTFSVVRNAWRNLCYRLGWRLQEPQPLLPATLLRSQALKVLAQSPEVETRFIARALYRGGATASATREQTSREFYENIAETDYTLCVRGAGNFSKRFYETLAMGRIPILIDTDCCLPFESRLSWADFIVRVPCRELAKLPEAVVRHFSVHGAEGLAELKARCRKLWSEWLSFGGFHRHLAQQILGMEKQVL